MQTKSHRQISARKLTVLLLLSVADAEGKTAQPILGTTRMQKLAFLVSERSRVALRDSTYFRLDFNFEPEKFGPADLDLYPDLDFLRAMRLIGWDTPEALELSSEPRIETILAFQSATKDKPALLPEERGEEELSFEYLLGFEPAELLAADVEAERERQYWITENGLQLLERLRTESKGRQREEFCALEESCGDVRRRFGSWSLRRLLKYVYDNYESMTTKSMIISKVKGTG
jgi:hypothetical protein